MPIRPQRLLPLSLCALAAFAVLAAGRPSGGGKGGPVFPAGTPSAGSAGARPNIVFILTDDQDVLLNAMSYLPAVRSQIAAQGLSFTNDYVPLSLCCPSRASILTGEHTHNHQVYTLAPPDGGNERYVELGHEDANLGTALHAAGYRTALLGKYLNGYPRGAAAEHVPPGWDEWDVPIFGAAYNEFDYTMNQNGTLVPFGHAPADYLTDVISVRARQFIRASAAAKVPFFLYLAPYAPHKPSTPAPRHAKLFPGVRVPRTPSFNEADVSDKPGLVRGLPLLNKAEIADLDRQYRLRLQSLQAVDEMVASVVATLRNSGQLDNTYIFFTSDNGYHMGQHRMKSGKYTPYEEDIRVPLLIRGPGIPAGHTIDSFVENVDFAPTIAELAGATLETPFDGRSLVPLLNGTAPATWRRAVLLEQFTFTEQPEGADGILEPSEGSPEDGPVDHPSHLGLRTPTYKYVEYATQEREYYDLAHDPYELQNLAKKMDAKFLDRLSSIVRALSSCAGDTCRQLEAQPMPVPPPHH